MMLGVTGPDDGLEGEAPGDALSTRIQGVVNYFGPTDLGSSDLPDVTRPLVRDFLGAEAEAKPELLTRASPLTSMTKDDPPILTFQGTKDPLVPYSQATKLTEALTAKGVASRVELLVGAGNG